VTEDCRPVAGAVGTTIVTTAQILDQPARSFPNA
jgi:hypothetical protein